jgi:hypothetical protein
MLLLNMTALQNGYQVDMSPSYREVDLRGGLPAQRADIGSADYTVRVNWIVDNTTQEALEAFYRSVTLSGEKFLCPLVVENFTVINYVAEFVPGTLQFSEYSSMQRIASAVLMVEPVANASADESLIELYETYQSEGGNVLQLLAKLVNEDLPA